MRRERILKDLAMVDRDLARVAEMIEQQRRIVADLAGTSRPLLVAEARQLLARFQALQTADRERRDRLAIELEQLEMWQ